ncbi:MAG: TIGR02679 domain-containing protein [Bacilli bacterium]
MNNIEEAVNYFKKDLAFHRTFLLFKEKYMSLGTCTGCVLLKNATLIEASKISMFLRKNYQEHDNIKISLVYFQTLLNESCFSEVNLLDLLNNYFNENIITSKTKKLVKDTEKEEFFDDIINSFTNTLASLWLNNIKKTKNSTYTTLLKRYNINKTILHNDLFKICNCLNNLPKDSNKIEPLSLFSSNITKDPHFLDLGSSNSNLFINALSYTFNILEENTRTFKIDILRDAGIIIDLVSNFVTTYNILGSDPFTYFHNVKEPFILSLYNIYSIKNITAIKKNVFIFENPTILNAIIDRKINATVIISSGMPNGAVYQLIDKLVESKCNLFYNGDYDPEGLLIADMMKKRYQEHMTLICYNKKTYLDNLSNNKISSNRLKKLNKVDSLELQEIKASILLNDYSSYQEKNLEFIIATINEINS